MSEPTGYVSAGRAEFGGSHNEPPFPFAVEDVFEAFGSVAGGYSCRVIRNNPRAERKAVPLTVGIGISLGPVFRCIAVVGGQKGLAGQAYCVKNLVRPEYIGNRRGRLSPDSLNQADCFAGFRIEAGQDVNTCLSFKLGNDRLGNRLINRAIEDNFSDVWPGCFPAGWQAQE